MTLTAIPDEALVNHIVILAKTGAGKTNAAKTVAEHILSRGERLCAIDPTDAWWGLRSSSDGKGEGFPIVVFGGKHADYPISGEHGAAIAEIVATSNISAVISTRLMKPQERIRFFTDFANTLMQKNEGLLNLIIDEAHLFAPQAKMASKNSVEMCEATNNLVSLGRGLGLRIILLSQRPAKLHNDTMSCAETLIAMRSLLPADRDAVRAWIKECATPELGKEIMESLPSLKTGSGWCWAPTLDVLDRINFPLASTFDSSKAPSGKDAKKLILAPINMSEIEAKLNEVAQSVIDNDPRHLKGEIVRLTRELTAAQNARNAQPAIDPKAMEEADRLGYERGCIDTAQRIRKMLSSQAASLSAVNLKVLTHLEASQALLSEHVDIGTLLDDELHDAGLASPKPRPAPKAAPSPAPQPRPVRRVTPAPRTIGDANSHDLTNPQRNLLSALAWWSAMGHDEPTKAQVAAIAGWKVKGSNLRGRLSEMSSRALIDYPGSGRVRLTAAGTNLAPAPDLGKTLLDNIRAMLTNPQNILFDVLVDNNPNTMTKEEIGSAIEWEPTGSNLRGRLSELSSMEIIEYPGKGEVALQAWVI